MVEKFVLPLRPAVGRDIWRGTTLMTTAQFAGGFFWLLSQVCGGVVFCCVRCLCGGGVRFGALCTNSSSPYMMWQCFCLLFFKKEKECGKWDSRSDLCSAEDAVQGSEKQVFRSPCYWMMAACVLGTSEGF